MEDSIQWKKTDNIRVRKHSSRKWEIVLTCHQREGAKGDNKTLGGFFDESATLAVVFEFRCELEFGTAVRDVPSQTPLARVRKFTCKTRDYRNVYRAWDKLQTEHAGSASMEFIEKMRKNKKSHRNIVDIVMRYLLHGSPQKKQQ